MPKILTRLQRDVISYILSSNEERELPVNSAAPYMQTFEGGFSPRLLFTLFMPNASRVILYMAEEGANDSADKRSEFNKRREIIKKALVEIANFIIDMAEHVTCALSQSMSGRTCRRIMGRAGGVARRFTLRRLTRCALCVPHGLCQNSNCSSLKICRL
ncbi:MAG: hypothetical protein LBF87_01120 [Treponema sp.]|jgi:hypothetical protein|nr:hypothetical protein [Treponema sp.]